MHSFIPLYLTYFSDEVDKVTFSTGYFILPKFNEGAICVFTVVNNNQIHAREFQLKFVFFRFMNGTFYKIGRDLIFKPKVMGIEINFYRLHSLSLIHI